MPPIACSICLLIPLPLLLIPLLFILLMAVTQIAMKLFAGTHIATYQWKPNAVEVVGTTWWVQ